MSYNSYNPEGIFNTAHMTSQASMSSTPPGVKRTAHDVGLDKELMQHLNNASEFQCRDSDQASLRGANGLHSMGTQNIKSNVSTGKKTKGRVKIKMEFIDNKLRRYTTFSKRKTGIMKKAYELSTLTGTQVMLLVASETGHVYTFATRKLQPMITSQSGKALIQTCLNSPDPPSSQGSTSTNNDQRMSATGYEETELSYAVPEDEQEKGTMINGTEFSTCSTSGTDSDRENGSPLAPPDSLFMPDSPNSSNVVPQIQSRVPPGIIFNTDVPDCSDIQTDSTDKRVPMLLKSSVAKTSSSQLYVMAKPVVISSKDQQFVGDKIKGGGIVRSGPASLVYTSGGVVYAQPQTSSDSSTSLLVNFQPELHQVSSNTKGTGNSSPMVAIPVNMASSENSRPGSQSLPTDLSMPLKKERR